MTEVQNGGYFAWGWNAKETTLGGLGYGRVIHHAVSAARAIVVAALPLVAILAAQPFVPAGPADFGWARIATAVWALQYVLLSIDPAMRDKIGAARDLAGLMQAAPTSAFRDTQQHR